MQDGLGREAALHVSHTHTHPPSVHKITVRQPHYGLFARVESVDVGVLECWLRLMPSGCSAEEADPLSVPNINVMSFLL